MPFIGFEYLDGSIELKYQTCPDRWTDGTEMRLKVQPFDFDAVQTRHFCGGYI